MAKLKIVSKSTNDAEIYIDDLLVEGVLSVNISMAPGGYPIAEIKVICMGGLNFESDVTVLKINE